MSKKAKRKAVYFHTIEGCPAYYVAGTQICYLPWRRACVADFFVPDLKTIRAQQKASLTWRAKAGYDLGSPSKYGYRMLFTAWR